MHNPLVRNAMLPEEVLYVERGCDEEIDQIDHSEHVFSV
jgi:hypothetical protein